MESSANIVTTLLTSGVFFAFVCFGWWLRGKLDSTNIAIAQLSKLRDELSNNAKIKMETKSIAEGYKDDVDIDHLRLAILTLRMYRYPAHKRLQPP